MTEKFIPVKRIVTIQTAQDVARLDRLVKERSGFIDAGTSTTEFFDVPIDEMIRKISKEGDYTSASISRVPNWL